MADLCSNFGDSAITKGQVAYFSSRMRKTAIFLLPVINLTSPSYSLTQICYKIQELWRFGHKYGPNCIFYIAHARNGHISISCQKSDHHRVPRPRFPTRCRNFGDSVINKCQIAYFLIAHARNAYISTSCQKSDVTIVFSDPDFS